MSSHGNLKSEDMRKWLYSLRSRGMKFGTENMQKVMNLLGKPHIGPIIVHIAGTNGKGSVSAMISAILEATGYRVGLYTSPHLIDLKERITINRISISEEKLIEHIERIRKLVEEETAPPIELTFFEYITATAICYFAENEVDIIVAETGLGGRYDATNILLPNVTVITRIGIDHIEQLGDSIKSVAAEKGGIIKKDVSVVSSAGDPIAMEVIRDRAHELGCSIAEQGRDFRCSNIKSDISGTTFDYEGTRTLTDIKTNLLGRYQAENCTTAIAACDILASVEKLPIDVENIIDGLNNVELHGRLEIVAQSPLTFIDCGHNPSAAREIIRSLQELDKRLDTLVYSSSSDKNFREVASVLYPHTARIVLTRYDNERAVEPRSLAQLTQTDGKEILITETVPDAMKKAKKITPDDETILFFGSIFLVGEVLSLLRDGTHADIEMAGF